MALKTLADKLNHTVDPKADINNIYRIKDSNRIVVQFCQIHKRNSFFSSYKGKTVLASDLGFKSNNSKIYLNEMLTPQQAALFHKVRLYKQQHEYKYAWTKNQRIFLRKTSDSEVLHIKSVENLI